MDTGDNIEGGDRLPAPPPAPSSRAPVPYQPAEPGWWLAADGNWYPPEARPTGAPPVYVLPNAVPPVVPVVAYPPGVLVAPKSKIAAGLLAIFLGVLGIHRFYLGNIVLGFVMLLLTVLSLGFLSPFVAVWGFIEGIVILAGGIRTDARGIPLV